MHVLFPLIASGPHLVTSTEDTDADETNADATDFEVVDVDAKKSHGPTFAVTTRVYSAELPYLKHFLKCLGFEFSW